jgi:PAS domain S-box-containing protein
VEASTAGDALIMLRSETAQLVLLDDGLPDMTQREACWRIKGNFVVPVLCVCKSSPQTAAAIERHRADAWLTEPVDAATLVSTIRVVLRSHEVGRELSNARAALAESEARIRTVGEAVPYGVWMCGTDGGLRYASQSFLDLLGMSLEEAQQFGWMKRLPPEDADPTLKKWLHSIEAGQPWDSECRILGTDGQFHAILTRGLPVRNPDGRITNWVGINLDIDSRKRLEEALRQSEERFRIALQHSPIAVFQQDGDLRYTWIYNPLPGWCDVDFIGKTDAEVFGDIGIDRLTAMKRRVIETGAGERDQIELTIDAEQRYYDITLEPLQDAGGAAAGISGAAVDITSIKRLENELRRSTAELNRSNRDLQEFAYVASHDLQEPLRTISSCVMLLAERYRGKLDKDSDYFFDHALEGANRMRDFIRDLLAYSRLSHAAEIQPSDADVALNWALMNLQALIRENQAEIAREPLPVVMADQGQLIQVFQNMVGNALKYRSEASPVIHISAEKKGGAAVFSIRDNGIGIDPAYAQHVFGVFKRLHGRDYPGTGIGLAVCKKIVEHHEGKVWVESARGEGATFHFTLPLAE